MNMNGRSIITTQSPARRRLWQRIFGAVTLPVMDPRPRWQEIPGRGAALAYDLDLAALHPAVRYRLAAHVARRVGRPYSDVASEMQAASFWPIDASGCSIVETADSQERPFLYSLFQYAPIPI